MVYARLADAWRAERGRAPQELPTSLRMRFRPRVSLRSLESLRGSVGWKPLGPRGSAFLRGLWASAAAYEGRRLVGWLGIVSDGAQHAFLVDVMVAPDAQGRGVGTALVRFAADRVRDHGIQVLHADFEPRHSRFYARSGFDLGLGAVRQLG